MVNIILKKWQQAGITNDFIFGNVMQIGNNCRDLLRAILPELHIKQVQLINTQKNIRDQYDQRGVRLDVFAEDDIKRVYDVEMQVAQQKDLGERIRYYQSKIDVESLSSGDKYGHIRDSYIIFLCPFDPCGNYLRRNTFELYSNEDRSIQLHTGAKIILLNSTGKHGAVTPELLSFFSLMNGKKTTNNFGRQIARDVMAVKRNPIREREFMDLTLKMYDARKEGKVSVVTSFAKKLKSKGYEDSAIRKQLQDYFSDQVSNSEIDQIINDL